MLVINTKEVQSDDRPAVSLKTLFEENVIDGGRATFGTVTVPPKSRIPVDGTGVHEQDEYSIIVKGSIVTGIGDQEYRLSAGDATLIPAGEAHWSFNAGDEDCEIVWVLVKK
jgi:mannose-6-phosphate isomerase-like protein (cupin superfamily)